MVYLKDVEGRCGLKSVVELMEPLLREAEARWLWLYCSYQDMWFSPRRLREQHAKGYFRFGPVNWELRDPKDLLASCEKDLHKAQLYIESVREEIEGSS